MRIWPLKSKPAAEVKSLASPDAWLSELFGSVPTTSGVSVTAASALKVPAVASAVRVISEAVASLDVGVVAVAADGTEAPDPSHPILPLIRNQANDWTDSYTLIRDLVSDALCRDEGGLAYVNWTNGRVAEVIRYQPGVIGVEYDANTGEPSYRVSGQAVPAQNVLHLRAPFGRAPLSLAREAVGLAVTLELHAARLFGRGARPSGLLRFPAQMGKEAVARARAAWSSIHEGGEASGQTAILYDGAEFLPLTFSSVDAQFNESRKAQTIEIARAFRVPPSMLFEMDRATWSNAEQAGLEFLTYCLLPWIKATEGALRRALLLPEDRAAFAIRFDKDDLTRADLQTRATAINSLIASRVLSPNEGRAWLDLPAYAGGDQYSNPNITQGVPPATDKEPANGA